MRALFMRCMAWLAVSVALLAGCQPATDQTSTSSPKARKSEAVASTTSEALPKLGDYLPPLDGGRIEVAPPRDWHIPSRSNKYLFRTQKEADAKYPCVVITADDYQGQGISNVSSKNVKKFASQMAELLDKDPAGVQPRTIGDFCGVTYRKRGKESKSVSRTMDLLYLDTVVSGRRYSVHLRTVEGSLEPNEKFLLAVVQGIRFLDEEKPEESEADKASDEPKAGAEEASEAAATKKKPAEASKEAPSAEEEKEEKE